MMSRSQTADIRLLIQLSVQHGGVLFRSVDLTDEYQGLFLLFTCFYAMFSSPNIFQLCLLMLSAYKQENLLIFLIFE